MAASMLPLMFDMNALHQGKTLIRRNVCLLCSRNYSVETGVTEVQHEKQVVELQVDREPTVQRHGKIKTKSPLWQNAYAKLRIEKPDIPVPTINHRGVDLPKKVKRDPLTILKALSETTQIVDPPVNYNFVDDQRLLHMKFPDSFQMKYEGRKTARKMMDLYKKAFADYKAAPDIPDFNPVNTGYEDLSLSVNALEERIQKRKVSHAMDIYERLVEQGEDIPIEVEEKLLEMLCVFNGEDPKVKDPQIPRLLPIKRKDRVKEEEVKWKATNADRLYQKHVDGNTVTPFMRNVYVSGMLKHSTGVKDPAAQKALGIYREMKEEEIPVYLCTYNMVMTVINGRELKNEFEHMKKSGLVPNEQTFVSAFTPAPGRPEKVKELVDELRASGMELKFDMLPLIHFANSTDLNFIEDIVDFIAVQKHWYLDHGGKNIFRSLMLRLKIMDTPEALQVAKKLYNLRKSMGIRYKVTDYTVEIDFYEKYFYLMLDNGSYKEFMEMFNEMKPVYSQSVAVGIYLEKIRVKDFPPDFLLTLYEERFNFIPHKIVHLVRSLGDVADVFDAMIHEKCSKKLKVQFADRAHQFYTDLLHVVLRAYRNDSDARTVFSSPAVKASLDVMLQSPAHLQKTWECYMSYAELSHKFFKKQDLSWETIFEKLLQVEDKVKIKQFLNKIKVSSTWADHDFLHRMQKPLENILDSDDREILRYILSKK